MTLLPNTYQIAAGNAGWPFQFRFAVHILWSRVPELWTLGRYTFMKNAIIILLSGIFICGCSKREIAPKQAIDLLVAGKDIEWHDGNYSTNIIHFTKREGLSIEGVHVVKRYHNGGTETFTAEKGIVITNISNAVSCGIPCPNSVSINLVDAQAQDPVRGKWTIKILPILFHL